MKDIHRITASSLLQSTHLPSEKIVLLRRFQHGGSVIFPTETIYGLGAIATDKRAVANLFALKGRSPEKPPPIIVSDRAQLLELVSEIPPQAKTLMEKFWPGALTIIFPARNDLPKIICGNSTFDGKEISTIAVRMTSHPLAKILCEEVGAPLVATSANFSGATGRAAAPQTLDDIPRELLEKVDVIIDGKAEGGIASTIVDCTVSPPRVLRQGAVELDANDFASPPCQRGI